MEQKTIKGKAAIVGIGEIPTGRYPDRTPLGQAVDVCVQAILDSGLDKSEIDYLMPTSHFSDPRFNTDQIFSVMVEEIGLSKTCKGNVQVCAGGASSSMQLKTAVSLIASGMANAVLCFHTEKLGTGLSGDGVIDFFATTGISSEWETPYGMHFSPVAAMIMRRYMHETNTTPEELASVCVSNRKWAQLNPNAMFKKDLTVEDVMNSKMISSPLHMYESNVLADGAAAFLVVSEELAKKCKTPVYILGEGGVVTHYSLSQEGDLTRFGYKEAADKAFEEAGISREDIGVCAIYDSYGIFQIIALEEMGFCKRGEAGKFFMAGEAAPGGKLPVTTNGGMLSQGHTGAGGGHAVLVEACRQLMGKAGERQVPNVNYVCETGTGGTYMDVHVTILGKENK